MASATAIDILGGNAVLKQAWRKAVMGLKGRTAFPPEGSQHLEPGELGWVALVRSGIPSESTESVAGSLGVSVTELSESLRLPSRTVHRRVKNHETLTPEESERNVRAARVLAKAQDLLGADNGRDWVLAPSRGLGGEIPIRLLDTADGFTAVMDELGRLEYGVVS